MDEALKTLFKPPWTIPAAEHHHYVKRGNTWTTAGAEAAQEWWVNLFGLLVVGGVFAFLGYGIYLGLK